MNSKRAFGHDLVPSPPTTIRRSRRLLPVCVVALATLSAFFGCGRPQAAPQNRMLISSLRTAVNTQNRDWLEKNAKTVEERRAAAEMSNPEYEQFLAIIAMAREGEWEQAEQETIAFQQAQQPTREEKDRVRKFRQ